MKEFDLIGHKVCIVEAEKDDCGFMTIYNRNEDFVDLSIAEARILQEQLREFFNEYDHRRGIKEK